MSHEFINEKSLTQSMIVGVWEKLGIKKAPITHG